MNDTSTSAESITTTSNSREEIVDVDEVQAYSPGRIFGVALVGACTSLVLYYLYQQMEPESKRHVKKTAFSLVKGQVRKFVGNEE